MQGEFRVPVVTPLVVCFFTTEAAGALSAGLPLRPLNLGEQAIRKTARKPREIAKSLSANEVAI